MAKRRGQPVHGWINLDKPVGMSSAKVVAIVRRVFNATKAGHGGTLDPLSSRGISCRHRRHFRQSRLMANAPMNWRERRCGHPVLWVQTGWQTCQ